MKEKQIHKTCKEELIFIHQGCCLAQLPYCNKCKKYVDKKDIEVKQ